MIRRLHSRLAKAQRIAPLCPEHGTRPFTEAAGRHKTGTNGVKLLA